MQNGEGLDCSEQFPLHRYQLPLAELDLHDLADFLFLLTFVHFVFDYFQAAAGEVLAAIFYDNYPGIFVIFQILEFVDEGPLTLVKVVRHDFSDLEPALIR